MATHSSILTWRIPWTEGPGGYSPQSHKESDTTEATQRAQQYLGVPGNAVWQNNVDPESMGSDSHSVPQYLRETNSVKASLSAYLLLYEVEIMPVAQVFEDQMNVFKAANT